MKQPHTPTFNRCAPARPGIAMLMVMGVVATVFVIGMGLIAGLPAAARVSGSMIEHDRAVYLAESGLTEAAYRLKNQTGADIWAGVNGRTVTPLDGTYDVSITDQGDGTYLVASTGRANGRDGRERQHQVSMVVRVQAGAGDDGGYTMQQPLISGGNITIPAGATIVGDVMVDGSVTNLGDVTGDILATRSVDDQGTSQNAGITNDSVEMPSISLDQLRNYEYKGEQYQARTITARQFQRQSGTQSAITADNPLGVVIVQGDVTLFNDLKVDGGVLVINGDVNLNGNALDVESSETNRTAFYAKDVFFTRSGSTLQVTKGPAYVHKRLISGPLSRNSGLNVDSGIILRNGTLGTFRGDFRVQFPAATGGASVGVNIGGNTGGGGGSGGVINTVTMLDYNASASAN